MKLPPGATSKLGRYLVGHVLRAHFEDNELEAIRNLGIVSADVIDGALSSRKQYSRKISLSLNSRWRNEDISDLLLAFVSQNTTWAIPMYLLGWGNDDKWYKNILDTFSNLATKVVDYLPAIGMRDIKYVHNDTGEIADSVDPEDLDEYSINLTFVNQTAEFYKFLDPDKGEGGILGIDQRLPGLNA